MSTQVLFNNELPEKKIHIDFTETRRTSFLPDSFGDSLDKQDSTLKTVKVLECHEDDHLFLYLSAAKDVFEDRPLKRFCTGSKYLGQWNKLGISGKGIYKYPHGVIYDGFFNSNGEFHGAGILVYPSGQKIEGIWKNGKLGPDTNFVTRAGVVMNKNYCMMPDRRFQVELENDFNPPGQEFLTDEKPPARTIPHGCYDVVEGFFDPRLKTVYNYNKESTLGSTPSIGRDSSKSLTRKSSTKYLFSREGLNSKTMAEVSLSTESEIKLLFLMMGRVCDQRNIVSWIPSSTQEEWIVGNCRKEWDEATKYRPDLYEEWTKGGAAEMYDVHDSYSVEFVSKLDKLQLSGRRSKGGEGSKSTSFVKNKQQEQELMAVDMLDRMLMAKSGVYKLDNIDSDKCRTSDLTELMGVRS